MIRSFSSISFFRRFPLAAASLAVLVSSAQASVILSPGPIDVNATLPISVVSANLATSQVVNGEVTGPKLYGDAEFSSFTLQNSVALSIYNIEISAHGNASGTFQNNSLPLSWDFTLAENFNVGGNSTLDWTLTYTINPFSVCSSGVIGFTGCASVASQTYQTSGTGFGQFNGTAAMTNLAGISAFEWSIDLDINWQPIGISQGGYSLSVNIPNNSIDLPAAADIPEPGTWALFGAGLSAMAVFRRARRK